MSSAISSFPEETILRPARTDDVPAIHNLLQAYADLGNLLPRDESELYHSLNDFTVITLGERILACAALEVFTSELGEVRSLAVNPESGGIGLGRQLVEHLSTQAVEKGLKRLMALTYVPQFFEKMGFKIVPKDSLPEKVWGICVKCYKFQHCDEIAVLKHL